MPKGAHARGYALQLKIKHCWKLFLFEMLCCVLAWMNEYIVQIISATRLWLISRYSHHTLKKRRKITAKNRHPCTEWFSSLCLQTNRKHMEKQSLICMQKTLFYTDNTTSTLTIIVFSISWSRMFALYVRQMCCKTQPENFEQSKNDSIASESLETSRAFRSMHLHYTVILVFFSEVLHKIWRIFPWSFHIVVISDVPTRYLIFCTKQTRKQSLFYRQHPERHVTFPECLHFFSRMVCLFGNTERCVVVSFSGATSVQWSDVEHALCAFSGVCLDYFQVFRRFGCAKWKYCEKWHLPAPKIWNPFIYTWSSTAWRISLRQGNIL